MNVDARSDATSCCCAVVGALEELTKEERRRLMTRTGAEASGSDISTQVVVRERTTAIISDVRVRGDAALFDMAERFDGVALESLEVPRTMCTRALDALDMPLRRALERAAQNIERVHRAMVPSEIRWSPEPGVTIGRRPDPLMRVGVYAPGGRAAYPSSVLMGVIPARVAGVDEVIVCSPPAAGGAPLPIVLAAACIAGADRVFAIGGAGAVAAMAIGTKTVPRVDRIVGPGNAYVAEAKLQLVDHVAIDAPAGPSELLVIASDDADARRIAHELLAQAEHDPDAAVVAVIVGSHGAALATAVEHALEELLSVTPRAAIAREALRARGALLSTDSMDATVAFANEFAAEHVLICMGTVETERDLARALRNAGTIFFGAGGSVAFGDYITGANHVLPTAGMARSWSGLSTLDFVRWTTWQEIDHDAAREFRDDVQLLAHAEGLPAHAAAALYAGASSL